MNKTIKQCQHHKELTYTMPAFIIEQ